MFYPSKRSEAYEIACFLKIKDPQLVLPDSPTPGPTSFRPEAFRPRVRTSTGLGPLAQGFGIRGPPVSETTNIEGSRCFTQVKHLKPMKLLVFSK